jgi:hypothetical protein
MEAVRIDGVPPSAELRAELAGGTVLLSFSRGKDSIAAWLALRDAGVNVLPFHLYSIPGLRFIGESLAYFEDYFGTRILNLPHPALYRMLTNYVFQPPERCQVIDDAQLIVPTYDDVNRLVRGHYGVPAHTWVCDGVRAADSPMRRTAMATHGPRNLRGRRLHIVWDWKISHVRQAMADAGVKLPVEYEWFGRSFDGIDARFTGPIRDNAPDDWATILDWFPLAELDLMRPTLKKAS